MGMNYGWSTDVNCYGNKQTNLTLMYYMSIILLKTILFGQR